MGITSKQRSSETKYERLATIRQETAGLRRSSKNLEKNKRIGRAACQSSASA